MTAQHHAPLRVAVIGAGWMANQVHYPSLASLDDVEIAAICDVDTARLNQTADHYEVEGRYSDYRKMVAETAPDAVYGIGQPHYMYDIWTWCLAQGLNLYIEKPMGLTIHQARSLAYLADKHGCITQVSFQRRTSPVVVALHAECLKRGSITHAVCRFYKHEPHAMTSARDHMMDDGVHAIDTLRYICGGEVTAIHALARQVGTPDINFFTATLEFDTGATALLLNSWTSGRRIFALEMHAPGICVEAEPEVEGYLYADGDTKGVRYDAREMSGGNDLYVYGGFQAKHREFADAIRSKTQPGSNFADAIKTMEVAEKILAMSLLGVCSTRLQMSG